MKINITFQPKLIYQYQNHSILQSQKFSLDQYDQGELEEILALNIIEYIPRGLLGQVLQEWTSKLSHKGKLILSLDDCFSVARMFFLGRIDLNSYNFLVHGPSTENWDSKKLNLTLHEICKTLETLGLKVVEKKIEGFKATCCGERP